MTSHNALQNLHIEIGIEMYYRGSIQIIWNYFKLKYLIECNLVITYSYFRILKRTDAINQTTNQILDLRFFKQLRDLYSYISQLIIPGFISSILKFLSLDA